MTRRLLRLWPWLVPPVLYVVMRREFAHVQTVLEVLIAAEALTLVARHPARSARILVTALPFDLYGMSTLYRLGVPYSVVHPLRLWPEAMLAGLAVAAVSQTFRRRRRLDGLDRLALGYVALATAYLVVPRLFVGSALGSQLSLGARELGWRSDVLYIAVFVVARRLALRGAEVERVMSRVVAVGAVVAALGLVEFFASGWWNHLAVDVLRVPQYQVQVLHSVPNGSSYTDLRVFGRLAGHRFVRVGSVLDYETVAFYLAVCLGLGAEMVARGRARGWMVAALPVLGLGLLVTQTRSGIIAGAVALALALRPRRDASRSYSRRLRVAVVGVLALAAPFVLVAGVGKRLTGDPNSNAGHAVSYTEGAKVMGHYPLGRGLATAAGGGQLAVATGQGQAGGVVITEDEWLQIGTQLGFLGLALYAATCLTMAARLIRARAPDGARPVAPAAAANALIGVLVGGTFLQPFIDPSLSTTLFLSAGLAMGVVDRVSVRGRAAPSAETTTTTLPRVDMDLQRALRAVSRWALLAVAMVVVALAASYAATSRSKVYSSTATLFVGSPVFSSGTLYNSQTQQGQDLLANTFAAMIPTPTVVDAAVATTGIPRSGGQVLGETSASVVTGTNLVRVTVTDPDPLVAQRLANAVSAQFVKQIAQIDPVGTAADGSGPARAPATISQPALLNTAPVPSGLRHNLELGGALGLVVAIALIVVVEYFRGAGRRATAIPDGPPDGDGAAGNGFTPEPAVGARSGAPASPRRDD